MTPTATTVAWITISPETGIARWVLACVPEYQRDGYTADDGEIRTSLAYQDGSTYFETRRGGIGRLV
jgi:hypothetical protein